MLEVLLAFAGCSVATSCPGPAPCAAWNVTLPQLNFGAPMAMSAKLLYLQSDNGTVLALDPATGAVVWRRALGCGATYCASDSVGVVLVPSTPPSSNPSSGTGHSDLLVAVWAVGTGGAGNPDVAAPEQNIPNQGGGGGVTVYRLGGGDGTVVWRNHNVSRYADDYLAAQHTLVELPRHPAGSPRRLVLLLPCASEGLLALDAGTGKGLWQYLPTEGTPEMATAAAVPGLVLAPFNAVAGSVVVLNATTGTEVAEVWVHNSPGAVADAGVGVGPDGVAVFGWDWVGKGTVVAVSPGQGGQWEQRWSVALPGQHSLVTARPIFVAHLVVVVDFTGAVSALDLQSGKTVWSTTPGSGCPPGDSGYQCLSIQSQPVPIHAATQIMVGVMDGPTRGRIHAISSADGSSLWQVDAGGDLAGSFAAPLATANSSRFFVSVRDALVRNPKWSVAAWDLPPAQ